MAERRGSAADWPPTATAPSHATKFAGKGHWEKHIADELIHILGGNGTLETMTADGRQSFALKAGLMIAIPQGTWHRFSSSEGVTLMSATPSPSEVVELDVDDPQMVEREPA